MFWFNAKSKKARVFCVKFFNLGQTAKKKNCKAYSNWGGIKNESKKEDFVYAFPICICVHAKLDECPYL